MHCHIVTIVPVWKSTRDVRQVSALVSEACNYLAHSFQSRTAALTNMAPPR